MEVTRLFDLLPHYDKYFPKEDAVCGKENGVWVRYSTKEYIEKYCRFPFYANNKSGQDVTIYGNFCTHI